MGLEGVEIVMKVEETFDVVIEDSEAKKTVTPGQLIDLVMSKVGRTQDAACLTQRAFHRLRASLIRQMGLKREQIRPDIRLSDLFPRPTRKQQFQQILGDIGVAKNLELVRPDWLNNSIRAAVFFGGITTGILLSCYPLSPSHLLVNLVTGSPLIAGIIFAILFGWLSLRLTRGMCVEFKPSMATVGNFSRWIAANAPGVVKAPPGQWSREQVSEMVQQIVIDILGCEKDYREDAHFVKDLGLS